MNLPARIPELDARGLRHFAFTMAAVIASLFGVIIPLAFGFAWPLWPWGIGAVFVIWACTHARSLRPVYRTWMRFGLLMNRITTPLILGVMFYGLFTPIALVMKLIGRDTMRRRFDKQADSYRLASRSRAARHMEDPF